MFRSEAKKLSSSMLTYGRLAENMPPGGRGWRSTRRHVRNAKDSLCPLRHFDDFVAVHLDGYLVALLKICQFCRLSVHRYLSGGSNDMGVLFTGTCHYELAVTCENN